MASDLDALLGHAATALGTRDDGSLARALAPWVDGGSLVSRFDAHRTEVLAAFDYDAPAAVRETNLDGDVIAFDELAECSELPPQVTGDNFRHWACIQFIFEEDAEGLEPAVDIWVAVVDVEGDLRIGYHEFGEGD